MIPEPLNVGALGILLLLVLDRVITLVKASRENSKDPDARPAGQQSVETWREHLRGTLGDALSEMALPIMNKQTDILARMDEREGRIHEMMLKHGFVLEDVQKSMEKLRVTNHEINSHLQRLVK